MIPDEAIEAAAKELWPGGTKEPHRLRNLRAALEAAAPHLMAAAWYEGRTHGAAFPFEPPNPATNPYRKPTP